VGDTIHFDCAALLFDMDGVLVDSSDIIERSWMAWAARHNLDKARLAHMIHGRKALHVVREIAPHLDAEAQLQILIRQEMEDAQGPLVFDGAARLLRALPRKRWAIVTSAPRAIATQRLQQGDLPIPDVLICAEDVAAGKPDPQGYLNAAQALGLAPADCVVVEDSLPGVAAGKAAGMRVLGVATTHRAEELRDADFVAPALADISFTAGEALCVRIA
jgi:sugar-phosphatase